MTITNSPRTIMPVPTDGTAGALSPIIPHPWKLAYKERYSELFCSIFGIGFYLIELFSLNRYMMVRYGLVIPQKILHSLYSLFGLAADDISSLRKSMVEIHHVKTEI